MNIKILVGSILAAVILVLVSLTGVVGYQTTNSSTIAIASPLFSVRSKRAIDQESKDFSCDYIGKNIPILISIQRCNKKYEFIHNIVNRIYQMSDEAFEKMIVSLINNIHMNHMFDDDYSKDVKEVFHLVRSGDKSILLLSGGIEGANHSSSKIITMYSTCHCITSDYGINGILGCILLLFYMIILSLLSIIQEITYVLN